MPARRLSLFFKVTRRVALALTLVSGTVLATSAPTAAAWNVYDASRLSPALSTEPELAAASIEIRLAHALRARDAEALRTLVP